MKSVKFLLIILAFSIFNFPYLVQGLEQTASLSSQTKTKLELLEEEVASKAANLKDSISQKLQNKFLAGFLREKQETFLSLDTNNGLKKVEITTYTDYAGKLNFKNLSQGDFLAVLGDLDEKGFLAAKKIIKLAPQIKRQIRWGNLTAKAKHTITFQDKNNQSQDLVITADTTIYDSRGEISFKSLEASQSAIVVILTQKDQDPEVRFIYLPLSKTK